MSDIDSLQWWVHAVNFGAVVTIALSLLFGGLSFFLNKRLGELKDVKAAQEQRESSEKIAGLTRDISEAEEKRLRAEKDLLVLQQKVNPRTIPATDLEKVRATLSKAAKDDTEVLIVFPRADVEAFFFARQLRDLLESAGWHIEEFSGSAGLGDVVGVQMSVNNAEGDSVVALRGVLTELGFKPTLTEFPQQSPNLIVLHVGIKGF